MRESRTYGFVRGAPGNGRPYRDRYNALISLDQAGWHGAKALRVPANITLVPLPPYSPVPRSTVD
jgi:transposase